MGQERITRDLSGAIFEFVLDAIQTEHPDEQQPREMARALIHLSDVADFPIERTVNEWVRGCQPGHFTTANFKLWVDQEAASATASSMRPQVLAGRSEQ